MKLAAKTGKKIWHIPPADPDVGSLAKSLKISPLLAQVLINRGVKADDKAHSFLNPRLTELIAPELMPGATQAAKRIQQAIVSGEKIAIYGDYDVDGITSVSILWHLLTMLNGNVEFYIPHRVDEGYGLNEKAIRQLADNGVNLIITVDCGISAVAEAKLAAELGVDLIITDHHQPGQTLPEALAIVHPSIDKSYPNPDSAGAMVAFKLAWALVNLVKANAQTPPELREFLLDATTLAAMGTIADVVSLRDENRILTSFGLKSLAQTKMAGIKALIHSADLTDQNLDSYHIAFKLAPLLNAAGRMGHARLAVDLLTSESEMQCIKIAQYLKEQNKLRQQSQRKIYKEARQMIVGNNLNHPDKKTIVLANENWHTGVIGIVASRVIDEFYRPTIMLSTDGELAQGSGRSVPGFDMFKALTACCEHLESFGGHAMAAGLKLRIDKIADFINAFEQYAAENIGKEELIATLDIDAMCSISELGFDTVKHLQMLEPFGQGNPAPIFATKTVKRISPPRRVGVKGDHLQIAISDNTASVRCIGFGMGKYEKKLLERETFNVAYEPQFNTYNGNTTVQFLLKDIQFE
jgi:single-stranded-DNA-specific exonuclease